MIKAGDLMLHLYDFLRDAAGERTITDVRLGRAYVAVCLDDGRLGLSGFPTHGALPPPHPNPVPGAACPRTALIGAGAGTVLAWLTEKGEPLQKALALATANALIRQARSDLEGDPLASFGLTPEDRVAMVGRFTPLLERIGDTGASLTVLEKDAAKGLVLPEKKRRIILESCTVAIITATTLLYDDLEDILNDLGDPRIVALLGPSTPMAPAFFAATPVTLLGGVRIIAAAQILPLVTAGGGTRTMRPFLELTNLFVRRHSLKSVIDGF